MRVSNKTHIPFHKNNEWITAVSVYAEKTDMVVFLCSLIGKPHIGHQPEPTGRAAGSTAPLLTPTDWLGAGGGVLYHFHFTVSDKWERESGTGAGWYSNAVLFNQVLKLHLKYPRN